jgi:hypothetical protein
MQSDSKVYLKIRKIKAMGQAPVPRYAHAACLFMKRYMAIYGGRNDYLMSETSKFMLNDLHLYDIRNNTWILISMYGCIFEGRAQHQIVPVNDDTLLIFGGMDQRSYAPTTLLQFISFNPATIALET